MDNKQVAIAIGLSKAAFYNRYQLVLHDQTIVRRATLGTRLFIEQLPDNDDFLLIAVVKGLDAHGWQYESNATLTGTQSQQANSKYLSDE
jgi:hypothetical protein